MSSSNCEYIIKSDNPNTSAVNAPQPQLPKTSGEAYNKTYEYFITWKNEVGMDDFSESTFLAFFENLAKTKQPSTVTNIYCKLKNTMKVKNGINIDNYKKLTMFLKQNMVVFEPKTSKVFTKKDINTFLEQAPDEIYLCQKVVLILGVHGACCRKLLNITIDDIERHSEQLLLVKMKDFKTKNHRSFVVRGLDKEILEKYLALRPPNLPTKRLLLRYANGRCIKQVLGRSRVTIIPSNIAEYLNLPNPELYTHHCFRRTAHSLSSYTARRIKKHSGVPAKIREVYVQVPKETQAINENEGILNANNIKGEYLDTRKKCTTSEGCGILSEKPAKITITENNKTRTISMPGENITIIFRNCQNVSDININF